MRRRILLAELALVTIILLVLEIPLAITFARREREAAIASVQRDAISYAALSEEVIEHPGEHDASALASRFSTQTNGTVVVVDRNGSTVAAGRLPGPTDSDRSTTEQTALDRARTGTSTAVIDDGQVIAAVPIGSNGDLRGGVLVSRSDSGTETRIHQLWLVLVVIAAVVLGVAALVGDRLAKWATAPLRRLDQRAAALGHGDLSARADVDGPPEVAELARTFNTMAARLETLVGNQRQFVADASHQLRSPLTALRLRLESIDLSDPDGANADIEAAQDETARLSRLVDGLLALARAEGGRLEPHPVAVRDVVEGRCAAWSALAEERGVAIELAPGDEVDVPLADGHLEQILDNLIDNAIEVSGPGSEVALRVARQNGRVEVHVTDGGPGLSVDERVHAFEPFWQGRGRTRSGSSGLGLSIVERLARSNGGEARLDDAPGGGLDAVVTFPVGGSPDR